MSYAHVELVYQRSTHQGAAHQVLAYLALRANDSHICWPGNDRMANDLRISKRTVIRAMQDLVEAGDVLLVREGSGRGNSSIWMLSDQYRPDALNSDITTPFETVNGDTASPFAEKGDIDDRKGDMVSKRVTLTTVKGDPVSPQRNKNKRERKERQGEIAHTREADAPSLDLPAGATSFAARFKSMTGYWVGFNQQDYLQERLGETPNWQLLGDVFKDWVTRGNNPRNLRGIFDWYDRRRADPRWQPYQQDGPAPAGSSKTPKTFAQIRQDNTLAAAQQLMEKYANEPA